MSVYTPLSPAQLATVLEQFGFQLRDYHAASHGIENSTFLIDARDRHDQPSPLVLTVFESLDHAALAPYLSLLEQLAEQHLPVPAPLPDANGNHQITVAEKPAVLMPRLPGQHDFAVDTDRCQQVGALLARLHASNTEQLQPLPSERARLHDFTHHLDKLPAADQDSAAALLHDWLAHPAGTTLIHGDLFRDNLLWHDGQISALLDFYNACLDHPEYDLAVALNDWCVDANGQGVAERERALLSAYRDQGRSVDDGRLCEALAVAALRFWLSRLAGPVSDHSEGLGSKDPEEFARIYRQRLEALAV
ncbi:homoserine kinase [Alcanivorax sp.]|uniref:homoserine kinase n=1 Tax=Alcanivorax sp. TaxID=1872427 RepID=UPI0032D948E7